LTRKRNQIWGNETKIRKLTFHSEFGPSVWCFRVACWSVTGFAEGRHHSPSS